MAKVLSLMSKCWRMSIPSCMAWISSNIFHYDHAKSLSIQLIFEACKQSKFTSMMSMSRLTDYARRIIER